MTTRKQSAKGWQRHGVPGCIRLGRERGDLGLLQRHSTRAAARTGDAALTPARTVGIRELRPSPHADEVPATVTIAIAVHESGLDEQALFSRSVSCKCVKYEGTGARSSSLVSRLGPLLEPASSRCDLSDVHTPRSLPLLCWP